MDENQGWNVLRIREYDVTCVKFKLCNFITSLKPIKTSQNFAKSSFFTKLITIYHKNRGEVLASGPL